MMHLDNLSPEIDKAIKRCEKNEKYFTFLNIKKRKKWLKSIIYICYSFTNKNKFKINLRKKILFYSLKINLMDSPAFFFTIFLWCLLISITGYSVYVGFGPPSKELRDPFEEHED